ncbi:porin family protein [Mucilaginibacter sp. UR6-11]|uniref:porin family protein n=1 Tax=Mucilaginibacter sp. UR6-11 TaxID=1435644 RepID=UPI001E637F39|nr:porin family protein [Mucilaginibacter sp. UR6-11]MCC8425664.1 PorT family protein [Mucilaginibacter sp. UR6-11]
MKKILFFAICLLVAGSVSAQRRYYHSPRGDGGSRSSGDDFYSPKIGLEIGANVSNQISTSSSNYSTGSLGGLNAGLTFDLPIIYPLSFAPEVLYSQKGYEATTANGIFTQRTHFIDVPLLAKFKVGPAFNFYIGPQLSYLLSTTNTYDDGFLVSSEHYYEDNNGHKSFLDGVLGVSFDLNRSVDLHARYTLDLQQTDSQGSTYVPNYRNQVWQFGIGFKLN